MSAKLVVNGVVGVVFSMINNEGPEPRVCDLVRKLLGVNEVSNDEAISMTCNAFPRLNVEPNKVWVHDAHGVGEHEAAYTVLVPVHRGVGSP